MSDRVLETERMYLRRLTPDDVDRSLAIVSDPIAMRYYPGTRDRDGAREWVEAQLARYARDGHGLWAAQLRADDAFVGQVGLLEQELDNRTETEIGYLLVRRFWGRGLATEAARACRDHGFTVLRRTRLVSLIDEHNAPSRAVASRVGMTLDRTIERWGKRVCVYAIERPPER